MTTESPSQVQPYSDLGAEFDVFSVKTPRRAVITEQPVVRNIIDVTMVGLIGGGPRLAARAAGVMIKDAYTSRDAGSRIRAQRTKRRP